MTLNNRLETIEFGFHKFLTLLLAVSLVCGACEIARADVQADTLSGFDASLDNTRSANPYIQAATTINIGAPTINLAGELNTAGDFTVAGNTTVNVTGALITSGAATLNSAGITNNATVGGSLGVTGNSTLSTLSTAGVATLNSASITNNATVGGSLGVTGVTTLTGAMTANGGATVNNGAALYSGAGAGNAVIADATSTRLVSGNATHNVVVSNANTTVNGGGMIYSGNGAGNYVNVGGSASGTNGVAVGDSQVTTVNGNVISYGTAITGGSLVNGSMGVNGNITSYNGSGNSAIKVANNGLSIAGDSNQVALTAQGASSADGVSRLSMSPTTTTLLVTNAATGAAHGLSIDQQQTVLSGGTRSTTLTLNDGGATFAGQGGIPARVGGVADGINPFDAANTEQLNHVKKTAFSGIASVAALAAIPAPTPGNNFSVGMGYGNYGGENAMAVGVKARVLENVTLTAGMGYGTSELITPNAGFGYSF